MTSALRGAVVFTSKELGIGATAVENVTPIVEATIVRLTLLLCDGLLLTVAVIVIEALTGI